MDLTLYFNLSTQQFAQGANSASPYFPPLNVFQTGQYSVAIYLVEPNGGVLEPWSYINPSSLSITAAQLAFGNRFNYDLYAIATTYAIEEDDNGNYYLKFSISLDSIALSSALEGLNSLSANFQFQLTTSSNQLIGQIVALIRRVIGSGISFGTYIPALVNITALTGGYSYSLDGLATVGGAIPTGAVVELVGVIINDQVTQYQLQAYSGAQNIPSVVLPDDYNSSTNAVAWIQIL
jgi:hypothetical protein